MSAGFWQNAGAPDLSVIIVSYKCRDVLCDCIDSLRISGKAIQVIVVDNASHDGTIEALASRYPNLTVIENATNVGFPAANNQGLQLAQSNNILLLNPDTLVTDGAIGTMVQFLTNGTHPKVFGPMICNLDGSRQDTVHLTIPSALRFLCEQIGLVKSSTYRGGTTGDNELGRWPVVVGWVSGAALGFNRSVIELIGTLDEQMFWAEDLDFCFRAGKAGIPVYYLPTARIMHHGGESGKRNYRRMVFSQHASRVEFARKHYGEFTELALRVAFALMLPIKMGFRLMQLAIGLSRVENCQRVAGYWDALSICLPGMRSKVRPS